MITLQSGAPLSYAAVGADADGPVFVVRERPPQAGSPKPRLLDRVRLAIRARHGSRRTEKAYVAWIRRYILFLSSRTGMTSGRSRSSWATGTSPRR
jgi:hypothetical protein